MTNPDNADVCPHGVRRELAWCARCADPAFDAARGGEAVAAAMNTKTLTFGGEAPFTSNPMLYNAKSKAEEIRATLEDMRRHGLAGGLPQGEAFILLAVIDELRATLDEHRKVYAGRDLIAERDRLLATLTNVRGVCERIFRSAKPTVSAANHMSVHRQLIGELRDVLNGANSAPETAGEPWKVGDTWHCRCGAANTAERCSNCKRARADEWGDGRAEKADGGGGGTNRFPGDAVVTVPSENGEAGQ